jgi:iron(III) transport system ATP-binding protein
MPSLEIRELKKKYGDVWAVDSVSFSVEDGEFLTLLGPSGCGKTTTLRCIAGLEKIDDGQITIGSRVVSGPGIFVPASQRFLGMVFQSYAIWPHMTVFDNVAFGLKCMNKNLSRELIREKTMQALKMVSLENLEHRQATDISGGQQQRVALARSLVYNPPVLLLDEPLSNLDARLRDLMRFELLEIHRKLKITTIYVTHDQGEAMVLSDRIIIMNKGKIAQMGSPQEIYQKPADKFIAEFLGVANILLCRIENKDSQTVLAKSELGFDLVCEGRSETSSGYLLLRPERIRMFSEQPGSAVNVFRGVVKNVAYLGNLVNYVVVVKDTELRIQADPLRGVFRYGEEVVMSIDPKEITLIPENS